MGIETLEHSFAGIKQGNKKDFETVFNIYFPRLMYYAIQFVDQEEAEDIVQDVFVELWDKRETLNFGDAIGSFLYRLVHNKSLNLIRHKQIAEGYRSQFEIAQKKLDYFSPDDNEIFQNLVREERFSALKNAIESLPEKRKKCFKLSYLYGLKSKEIAEIMGLSIRTVETHIYKSLQDLRKTFDNKDLIAFFMLYYILR